MDWITDPQSLIALVTITVLEIVLGIDNIVFISILVGKLEESQQKKARFIGLAIAMVARIALLFSLTWIMRLTFDLFTVLGQGISGRDIILLAGGLFLLAPGGALVYSVCTFTAAEGPRQIEAFLARHREFVRDPDAPELRTWPHRDESDGFFAVRLRRAG